jgi:hypothetical protein
MQFHEDFGLDVHQLLKAFLTNQYIPGVKKVKGRLNGFADLTFTYRGTIWVWEIKSNGYKPEVIVEEVKKYVAGLRAQGLDGHHGIPLYDPSELTLPKWLGGITIENAVPGGGNTGAITYEKISYKDLKGKKAPKYVPVAQMVRDALKGIAAVLAGRLTWEAIILALAKIELQAAPEGG